MKHRFLIVIIFFLLYSCFSLKTKSNVAIDYYNLGNKFMTLKEYSNAIESYKKSLEFNPKSDETIFNLILCYQFNKEYDNVEEMVIKHFKRVNNEFTKKPLLILGNNYYLKENYEKAINKNTVLISIMYANNEIGTIQPIEEISKIAKEAEVDFHTDAVQAIGKVKIDLSKLNVDSMSISGHKIYAPKGIGILFKRKGSKPICPLIIGGHQENSMRAGTENTIGATAKPIW